VQGCEKIAKKTWNVQPPHMHVTAACLVVVWYSLKHSNGVRGPAADKDLRNVTHTHTNIYILNKCVHRNHTFYIKNQAEVTEWVRKNYV
jgi:hypothetical protein